MVHFTLPFRHHNHRFALPCEILGIGVLLSFQESHHLSLGRRLSYLLVVLQSHRTQIPSDVRLYSIVG